MTTARSRICVMQNLAEDALFFAYFLLGAAKESKNNHTS